MNSGDAVDMSYPSSSIMYRIHIPSAPTRDAFTYSDSVDDIAVWCCSRLPHTTAPVPIIIAKPPVDLCSSSSPPRLASLYVSNAEFEFVGEYTRRRFSVPTR